MFWRDWRLRWTTLFTVGMMGALVLVWNSVPEQQRLTLLFGAGILIALGQIALILGKRPRRTFFSAAQQAFMTGDYEGAVRLLTATQHTTEGQESASQFKTLTLLGNSYRQLGQLEESEKCLREALQLAPQDAFPLYGLGRTLLVKGDYLGAAEAFRQTLAQPKARRAVQVDLALALYYAGAEGREIVRVCEKALRVVRIEGYRALMIGYLLYNQYQKQMPNYTADQRFSHQIMANATEGLPFWQAEAKRHAETPFGKRLAADVKEIESLLIKEGDG